MKHIYLLLFTFNLSFCFSQTVVPPSNLSVYYDSANVEYSASNSSLYDDLATIVIGNHSPFLTYSQRHNYLYDADTPTNDPNNVTLIYSGDVQPDDQWLSGNNPNSTQTYNTEHVYPRSLLGSNTAEADLYLLRACIISVNSLRGNDPFRDGSGNYFSSSDEFFPGQDWRGDVARIIMYVNLRYNEPFTDVGSLALFLAWNAADPVDVDGIEDNRNTVISDAQGNRNPFVDNPYLATLIWGGAPAQNRWTGLSNNQFLQEQVKIYPNPANGNEINIISNKDIIAEVYDILGKRVNQQNLTSNQRKLNISGLKKGIYLLKLKTDSGTVTKKLIRQ
jgi:endonuclease I